MPRLADVVHVLQDYRDRYEFLDAFVDDIEDLYPGAALSGARQLTGPYPAAEVWVEGRRLGIEVFDSQGIARFRLLPAAPPPPREETIGLSAALGGVLGAAAGAATEKKENLLGGIFLGLLVGGLLGAAASEPPAERALALRFDPASVSWRLYDGPLLQWAKRTLRAS